MDENDPLYDLMNHEAEEESIDRLMEEEFFEFNEADNEDWSVDEFFTDDEDDLGFFHYDDEYWRCVEGKRLFLKVKDSFVAEASVFSELERPESRTAWHYEAVLFLLEELETFLMAWKRRSTHSFTAHLNQDKDATGSDSDEERPVSASQSTNSVLSKRKFCESTRIFYSIFPNYDPFYEVYREVQSIKKRILDIRFALFLSSIPPEVVRQLPDELWLKIWRFSACPQDTLHLPFSPVFNEATVPVEKNRLSEFFLSVLRLHKILYKILFTFVLNDEPMQEMYAYPGAPKKVIQSLFWTHLMDVRRTLRRLNELDPNVVIKRGGPLNNQNESLGERISQGSYALESVELDGEFLRDVEQVGILGEESFFFNPGSQSPVWNSCHVFFPNSQCDGTFLFLQKYLSQSHVYIRFLVWNALSKSLEAVILTDVLLVDYISCLEYGYNMISFAGSVIAFTLPNLNSDTLNFSTFKWCINSGQVEQKKMLPPDPSPIRRLFTVDSDSFKYKPNSVSQALATTLINDNGRKEVVTLLMYSVEENVPSKLHGYLDESPLFVESFPPKSSIKDVKGDKVLVMSRDDHDNMVVQLFDCSARRVLYTYVTEESGDLIRPSLLTLFDRHPSYDKFLIFLQHKRTYLLLDYSELTEAPIIAQEGYLSSEAEECVDKSLTLYKDNLFFIEKGNQLQDRYQYYIKFFDFDSSRIVTPIYMEDSSLVGPTVETYFVETKSIFFIGEDRLAFCKNRKTLIYLDFTSDPASSVAKELAFLKN